jgi:hypothetical protein
MVKSVLGAVERAVGRVVRVDEVQRRENRVETFEPGGFCIVVAEQRWVAGAMSSHGAGEGAVSAQLAGDPPRDRSSRG